MSLILDGTNGISDVDGTAAAPAIRGTDTNTGIFFPAADTIAFAEGGTEVMRIDTSGNVGIGTSSPTQLLDVNGNVAITGSARRITGDFSNATAANRVAFQTSTVNGNTTIGVLPNGTGNSSVLVAFNGADPANSNPMQIRVTATDAGLFLGANGTATAIPMTFSNGGSERMRIDTSGNVGIGFNNTGAFGKLQVGGSSYQAIGVLSTDASGVALALGANASSEARINVVTNHPLMILTNNTERVRVDTSGNVGIGTSSPIDKLQVNGGVTFGSDGVANNRSRIFESSGLNIDAGVSNGRSILFNAGGSERARISNTGQMSTTNGAGAVALAYDCRAWVNFNGTGTVAIRASGNVSSITDGGVGIYTVNFANAMPDVNYAVTGFARKSAIDDANPLLLSSNHTYTYTTSAVQVKTVVGSWTFTDGLTVCVAIFR